MARKQTPQAMRDRAARTANAMSTPSAGATLPATAPGLILWRANTPKFFREVRAEARKIHWTSRQETWITSVMVAIMVVLAALYFSVVDLSISFGVTQILKFASAG